MFNTLAYNMCVDIAFGEEYATTQQKTGKEGEQKAHVACTQKACLDYKCVKILCSVYMDLRH